jgi:hypothetical protein
VPSGPDTGAEQEVGSAGPAWPPASAPGVVARARSEVAGLAEVLWSAREPAEQLAAVTELEQLRSVLDAVELRLVA